MSFSQNFDMTNAAVVQAMGGKKLPDKFVYFGLQFWQFLGIFDQKSGK